MQVNETTQKVTAGVTKRVKYSLWSNGEKLSKYNKKKEVCATEFSKKVALTSHSVHFLDSWLDILSWMTTYKDGGALTLTLGTMQGETVVGNRRGWNIKGFTSVQHGYMPLHLGSNNTKRENTRKHVSALHSKHNVRDKRPSCKHGARLAKSDLAAGYSGQPQGKSMFETRKKTPPLIRKIKQFLSSLQTSTRLLGDENNTTESALRLQEKVFLSSVGGTSKTAFLIPRF